MKSAEVPGIGEGTSPRAVKDGEPEHLVETLKTEQVSESPPAPISATLQGLTDKALHFLSHASNETLGACVVGLGAATYLVLGRVGLVIIGVAGGAVLHATWEGIRNDDRDEGTKNAEKQRRREAGVEVVKRVLEWRASKSTEDESEGRNVCPNRKLDFSSFEPDTGTALTTFTGSVIQDYVYYWYGPQLPGEETFPASCRRTLTAFILSLSGHLHRKRPADAFLDFVTNASSILIVFLNELSVALDASPHSTPADAIEAYLKLKPDSSLAYVLDQKSQDAKLGLIAEDILQAYLDPKAYNCDPVHVFLKQVLAKLVLGSTVNLCSRPEWINEWIVYGLEESKTTQDIMDIVDAGVEGRNRNSKATSVEQTSALKNMPSEEMGKQERLSMETPRSTEELGRHSSRGEEAMDEAMREAKRLTQLMVEEDERRARDEQEKQVRVSSSEDVSETTTQGAATPTSSQSDRERHDDVETASRTSQSETASLTDSTTLTQEAPSTPSRKHQFTSFDQIVPAYQPTALLDSPERLRPPPAQLTLHNANISIFDDSVPGEKTSIKAKPTIDYLIQIEPSSSAFPGWMIARKYADFETLHEILRRISVITGVSGFAQAHTELPKWRVNTKASLRTELERYLTDAVRYQPLAESEGMKRFLEKDQGLAKSPGSKGAFAWPTPDAFGKIGGDMMNVLTKAPKQVAGGGKAFVGGVTGGGKAVLGGVAGLVGGVTGAGGSKRPGQPANLSRTSTASTPEGHRSRTSIALDVYAGQLSSGRQSQDSLSVMSNMRPTTKRHVSSSSTTSFDVNLRSDASPQRSSHEAVRTESATTSPVAAGMRASSLSPSTEEMTEPTMHLPPPPSEMPEDYGTSSKLGPVKEKGDAFASTEDVEQKEPALEQPPSLPTQPEPTQPTQPTQPKKAAKLKEPISESETSVAVELMFAVITELYTLSSAWNFRRTLLTAAKSFLLRPGNPQLLTIKDMLQSSLLDSNLSDSGLASHIYKLRENALPTEEEMEIWRRDYPAKNDEEKEELRQKARKLLVQKGMPTALQSVMGAAASGEALGKVFDCLQVESVSRGLVFGLMLQALRVVTH